MQRRKILYIFMVEREREREERERKKEEWTVLSQNRVKTFLKSRIHHFLTFSASKKPWIFFSKIGCKSSIKSAN
jgi:hypothetical protein